MLKSAAYIAAVKTCDSTCCALKRCCCFFKITVSFSSRFKLKLKNSELVMSLSDFQRTELISALIYKVELQSDRKYFLFF